MMCGSRVLVDATARVVVAGPRSAFADGFCRGRGRKMTLSAELPSLTSLNSLPLDAEL